jgi:hypothetical protein
MPAVRRPQRRYPAVLGRSRFVNALHSLYDALIAINVPAEKARAVTNAFEQDIMMTMATKVDLLAVKTELKNDLLAVKAELKNDLQEFKLATKADFQTLEGKFETQSALLRKDIQLVESSMTIKLGSLVVVGLGVLFAALKLT